MITDVMDPRPSILKTGAMVGLVAGGAASAVAVYLLSTGRTCTIKKVHIANRNAANLQILFGTGLAGAFAQSIPSILVPTGTDRELTEDELADLEFTADITAQPSVAAAAPNDIQVMVTVEEYQGVSG